MVKPGKVEYCFIDKCVDDQCHICANNKTRSYFKHIEPIQYLSSPLTWPHYLANKPVYPDGEPYCTGSVGISKIGYFKVED